MSARLNDARLHLDEAMNLLTLEAYRGTDLDNMERVEDFTIAEELERVDRAIGPKGTSMFAGLADAVRSAYVEIKAAREALK
jgi:hypothetical protein